MRIAAASLKHSDSALSAYFRRIRAYSGTPAAVTASPALLEGKMLRGGMGTGMPYWDPIFTPDQMDAVTAYLYNFTLNK